MLKTAKNETKAFPTRRISIMQMTLRWYGSKYDTVTLKQIRQIPGVTGVISTLYGTAPGEVWEMDDILALKTEIEAAGLQLAGIESVNIHDAIKIGSPDREQYIENYITTLERLGQAGIHMVCYNFMPVFDWTRTELARMRPDGSTVLAYNQAAVDAIDPAKMFESIAGDMNGTVMPGWEPERMAHVKELFEMYKDVDDEKLFANLKYFLERIMPTCDKYDINMAIHPDDPAWSVFGLPRIIINKQNIRLQVRCNGKSETDKHSAGISFYRCINEDHRMGISHGNADRLRQTVAKVRQIKRVAFFGDGDFVPFQSRFPHIDRNQRVRGFPKRF